MDIWLIPGCWTGIGLSIAVVLVRCWCCIGIACIVSVLDWHCIDVGLELGWNKIGIGLGLDLGGSRSGALCLYPLL